MKLLQRLFGRPTRTPAARPKVRLGCEELGGRLTPALVWIGFDVSLENSQTGSGAVQYDDADVNFNGWQQLEIFDFNLTINGQNMYHSDIVGTVDFINGVFQGITIEGEFHDKVGPGWHTGVGTNWTEIGVTDSNWNTIAGTIAYTIPSDDPPIA